MRTMVRRPVLLCCLTTLLVWLSFGHSPAKAWTPEGHQVICAITESLLDDDTKREAERLLAAFEAAPNDLPSACAWLDRIRSRGVGHFDHWHYINQPVNPQGLALPPLHRDNVIFAITQSLETLRDPSATMFGRAFALRVLLHVVGDIHQPLHTVSRFSSLHPQGDRGGNDFPVTSGLRAAPAGLGDSLHIFWDRGLGLFDGFGPNTEAEAIRSLAAKLARDVTLDDLNAARELDPQVWADEGLRLAETYVYRGIEEGDEPSTDYVRRAEPVVERQLVLAAHRLASMLDSLLTPPRP